MKTPLLAALISSATIIAGCTATPQMVEAQKGKCTQIGYAVGSPAYLACVERGVQMGEAGQNAAAASAASATVALGVANLLF